MKKRYLLPIFATFMIATGAMTHTGQAEASSVKELTTTAYQYKGIKYVYGGTTTNGFDCSGFVRRVFSDLGIGIARTSAAQYQQGTAVSQSNLYPGDLVFFNTMGRGVSHVGIYIGNNRFIHSQPGRGVSVTSLNDPYYWGQRYIGAKRLASFDNKSAVAAVAGHTESIDFSMYASRGEVALQLATALQLDTSDTTSPFPDVNSSSKYAGAVTALHKLSIFSGDEHGKFHANAPITRAQLAKIIVIAFEMDATSMGADFTDVPNTHWSYPYISEFVKQDFTSGKGDGTFGASDYVQLKHLAIWIDKAKYIQ